MSRRDTGQQQQRAAEEAVARQQNLRSGRVLTPDGPGTVLCREKRKNTNQGPGTNQWRVQLDDGRVRHYTPDRLTETP